MIILTPDNIHKCSPVSKGGEVEIVGITANSVYVESPGKIHQYKWDGERYSLKIISLFYLAIEDGALTLRDIRYDNTTNSR